MKILIAYDGSSCSEAALDDLVRAGLPEAGEFAVMSVAEVWLAPENLRLQWEAENPDSDYLNEINRRHDKKSKETIAEFATLANHAAVMWSSLNREKTLYLSSIFNFQFRFKFHLHFAKPLVSTCESDFH